MQHNWNCVRCNGIFYTYCHEMIFRDGETIQAWEDLEFRHWRDSDLCHACYTTVRHTNPLLEKLHHMKEDCRNLERDIRKAKQEYEDNLDVTPERKAFLETQQGKLHKIFL